MCGVASQFRCLTELHRRIWIHARHFDQRELVVFVVCVRERAGERGGQTRALFADEGGSGASDSGFALRATSGKSGRGASESWFGFDVEGPDSVCTTLGWRTEVRVLLRLLSARSLVEGIKRLSHWERKARKTPEELYNKCYIVQVWIETIQ